LVHMHAKDISTGLAQEKKGKLTGTPVGCACGEGVIDWTRVASILSEGRYRGVLSVECGTSDQAAHSLSHLKAILQRAPAASAK
jgi:sugar phosphate isomerase/epimerase